MYNLNAKGELAEKICEEIMSKDFTYLMKLGTYRSRN